ncbi:hypothetical protein HanIR_Chr15g0775841 [Helianthus annuus]|nr:hypothetical protein HanIR_Chr15g0775841 [Helianthus annuus]
MVLKQEGSYLVLLLHWLLARNLFRSENPTSYLIEKLNLVIKELVKEKDKEKERFNGINAGCWLTKKKIRWIKMRCLIGCHKLKLC